jgi:hypothetical protein
LWIIVCALIYTNNGDDSKERLQGTKQRRRASNDMATEEPS